MPAGYGMSLIERMQQARFQALDEDRRPLRWRFSHPGYTELMATADEVWRVQSPTGEPQTILGLPFDVSTDLPRQTDFELVLADQP